MKTYTSKEIVENVIDAAERSFESTIAEKKYIEPAFRSLLAFLRGVSLEQCYRWDVSADPIARARFVGAMIGKAYGNSDSHMEWFPTVSGAALVDAFGFVIGMVVAKRCERDIFVARMSLVEDRDTEDLEKALKSNRENEEEGE